MTSRPLTYLAPAGPKFVEWINDSSANVLFADAPTAKRAVAGLGKPLPPDEAPEQLGEWKPGAVPWAERQCRAEGREAEDLLHRPPLFSLLVRALRAVRLSSPPPRSHLLLKGLD